MAGDDGGGGARFKARWTWPTRKARLSWRLRAVTSRARLRLEQGRLPEARDSLAETYGRFTEGFKTLDLRPARALLAEIDAREDAGARN